MKPPSKHDDPDRSDREFREADQEVLAGYVKLVNFLGQALSLSTEIVLHDLSNPDASIIAIANGHVSGRSVGAPATDLVLRILKTNQPTDEDSIVGYAAKIPCKRTSLLSSSYLIRREGRLIGMLCVNSDMSAIEDLQTMVESLVVNFRIDLPGHSDIEQTEDLVSSVEVMAQQAVSEVAAECGSPIDRLHPDDRIEVCRRLYERGFFQFKGSVPAISEVLGVSGPTAYRYLQSVKANQDESPNIAEADGDHAL